MSSSTDPAYRAFVQRLFSQNQFSIKLGLDRMRRALDQDGSPDAEFSCVVVAGTNGKGTTSALLSEMLRRAGLKVGLYSSPHLVDVRERFRIDGQPVSREAVLAEGQRIFDRFGDPALGDETLTFFELTTMIALSLFRAQKVDVAVLEVGLGGRLDAVNTVDPVLSLVTSIGLDHQKYLGDTLEAIALEKVAVCRPGRPVILGHQRHAGVGQVLRARALELGAVPCDASDLHAQDVPDWLTGGFSANVASATRAFEMFCSEHIHIDDNRVQGCIEATLRETRWPGRRDPIELPDGPWFFDVAHNPDGIDSLLEHLEQRPEMPAVGIVGVMKDKDWSGMAERLGASPIRWVAARAETPRALDAATLGEALGTDQVFESVAEAVEGARRLTQGEIVVCGSVYLLGEVLETLDVPESFFLLR